MNSTAGSAPGAGASASASGWGLAVLRAAWFAIVGACVALYAVSIPLQIGYYQVVCPTQENCPTTRLVAFQLAHIERIGLSLSFYAYYITAVVTVFVAVFLGVAFVIFWRKSDDRMAVFASLALVLFGVSWSGPLDAVVAVYPGMRAVSGVLTILAGTGLATFLYLFPDGRFAPRWARWLLLFVAAREAAGVLYPSDLTQSYLLAVELASGAAVMIYRYLRVSNPVERQQTKWVVFGSLAAILGSMGLIIVFGVLLPPEQVSGFLELAGRTALYSFVLFIPLSIGVAILRARLWDIDIIIRRTLVYAMLTAALALVYLGSVVLLQAVLRGVTGESGSGPAAVISTLAIATLFTPLRRRIQTGIDRRFYRRKYDAERVLGAFGAAVRDEVDLAALTDHLVAAVDEAMHPESVTLWVRHRRL